MVNRIHSFTETRQVHFSKSFMSSIDISSLTRKSISDDPYQCQLHYYLFRPFNLFE